MLVIYGGKCRHSETRSDYKGWKRYEELHFYIYLTCSAKYFGFCVVNDHNLVR